VCPRVVSEGGLLKHEAIRSRAKVGITHGGHQPGIERSVSADGNEGFPERSTERGRIGAWSQAVKVANLIHGPISHITPGQGVPILILEFTAKIEIVGSKNDGRGDRSGDREQARQQKEYEARGKILRVYG
jgi:hypothetical protein